MNAPVRIGKVAKRIARRARKPRPLQADVRIRPFQDVAHEICAAMSPLEWKMEQAFKYILPELTRYHAVYIPRCEILTFADFPPLDAPGIIIVAQIEIDKYKADFAVLARFRSKLPFKAAVECDGHTFHERTPEQATHDRSRDRAFTALGIHPLRYTALEINSDPVVCARNVIEICMGLALP